MKSSSRLCSVILSFALCMGILVPNSALAGEPTEEDVSTPSALPTDPSDRPDSEKMADAMSSGPSVPAIISEEAVDGADPAEDAPRPDQEEFMVDAVDAEDPENPEDNQDAIVVQMNATQTAATITLDIDSLRNASYVQFPTWSLSGGQDDLVWYGASRNAEGQWERTIDLSAHHSVGAFAVHVYAMVDGSFHFVAASSFTVHPPKATISLVQSDAQRKNGTFDVLVTDIDSKTPVREVQLPTWSVANGQDDIVWYTASKTDDGYAVKNVPCVGARRSPGDYISHAYFTLANNAFVYVAGRTAAIEVPGTTLTANLSADGMAIQIEGRGGLFDLASSVQYPTWSTSGGQDDLRWYGVNARSDGAWKHSVRLFDHRDAGDYAIHAYGVVNGVQMMLAATTVNVPSPQCSIDLVQDKVRTAATQKEAGTFDIEITGLTMPSGAKHVQVPTWSVANGQDDIVWYTAAKDGDAWVVRNVPCAGARRTAGDYISHVYVTGNNDVFAFAGGTTGKAEVADPTIQVTNVDDKDKTIKVVMKGGNFAGADTVLVPTWSTAGGQDDIVWYTAQRQPDGSWVGTIDIANHRTAGTYAVHTYATTGGEQRFGGTSSFSVKAPGAKLSTETDDKEGTITLTVSDVESPSGVKLVQIPTWTAANDQDDIIWYTATKQDDGTYQVTVKAADHSGQEGPYTSHVYVTGANGVMACTNAVSDQKLELSNYIFVTGNMGSGSRYIYIKNPTEAGAVQMPTWSCTGGQDDIVWYGAQGLGDNLYRAYVSCSNLKHEGTVICHVYAGGKMVGSITFTVNSNDVWSISGDPTLDAYLRQIISTHGTDLRTLYEYVSSFPYINMDKYPSGNWSVPFAKQMYERHGGNCYRYAALFMWLARAVGYDANVVSGHVPSRSQGWAPHGWVEIYINGATYVCDPDMNHAYSTMSFWMFPYSSAPFTYRK